MTYDAGWPCCSEHVKLTTDNKRMKEALEILRKNIKEGALVPLPGYSDEISAINLIDRALGEK